MYSYMVKVVHRLVRTYMCVRVSPCACVFEFADVFVYGEGCAWVETKALLCGSNKSILVGRLM